MWLVSQSIMKSRSCTVEAFLASFIIPDKFENRAVDFFVFDAVCVEAGKVELRHQGLFREEVPAGAGYQFVSVVVMTASDCPAVMNVVQLVDEFEEVLVLLVEDGDTDRVFPLPFVVDPKPTIPFPKPANA